MRTMAKIYYDWKEKLFQVNALRKGGMKTHDAVKVVGCGYVSYYAWVRRFDAEMIAHGKKPKNKVLNAFGL